MIKERYFIQNIIDILDEAILLLDAIPFLDKTRQYKI